MAGSWSPQKDYLVDRRNVEVPQGMERKRTNRAIDFLRPEHTRYLSCALWQKVHFDWLLVVTIRRAALAHGKAVRRMTLSLSKGPATVCFTRLNFCRSLRGTFAISNPCLDIETANRPVGGLDVQGAGETLVPPPSPAPSLKLRSSRRLWRTGIPNIFSKVR